MPIQTHNTLLFILIRLTIAHHAQGTFSAFWCAFLTAGKRWFGVDLRGGPPDVYITALGTRLSVA